LKDLKIDNNFRLKTGIEELDNVLGGGIVQGSIILLGGDPGIGKSTLAIQVADKIKNSIYISGEESPSQIKIRAQRLNLDLENLDILPQTSIEKIVATLKSNNKKNAVIDSIQTIHTEEISSAPGSVSQITACTVKLVEIAKKENISIIIIGHVTKDGLVAGPKTLEHLVDVVIYLENDNQNYFKILRGIKNRYGSTGEIGVFEMTSAGLSDVKNPSQIFIEDQKISTPGKAMSVVIEGTRPFLVEIQALVTKTVFGYPQRRSSGYDLNRLQMIIAVISKVAKINLSNQDIYLNVAGGIKLKDTCVDLAVAMAIISAYLESPIDSKNMFIGEIGLSGEIRNISQLEKRINEAKKLQFNKIIIPNSAKIKPESEIIQVSNIQEAVKIISTPGGK
jgi:DNA repair protein RadA/Sms